MAQDQRRLDLQQLLEQTLGTDKVYFQPPPNVAMVYPAIVYNRDSSDTKFADDKPYARTQRYQVTVIDRDPDSEIPGRVAALPQCRFQRFFATSGLNHDVFHLVLLERKAMTAPAPRAGSSRLGQRR
jgi:hypothetical protein